MSIGKKVDALSFKQRECIEELVELFRIIEEKKNGIKVSAQTYRFLVRLESVLMDWGEEVYEKYIDSKKDRKINECINLLFDLVDRNEAVLCYYHDKNGAEGDMAGGSNVLWKVIIQCVSDGLIECGKSIEDLVRELRNEEQR